MQRTPNTERLKKFIALALEAAKLDTVKLDEDNREVDTVMLDAPSVMVTLTKTAATDMLATIRTVVGNDAPGPRQLWEVTEWRPIPSAGNLDPPDVADRLIGRYVSDEEAARRAVLYLVEEYICDAICAEALAEANSC